MNAPVASEALAKPHVEMIAVGALMPSATHIQALRRQRFSKESLAELASSIKMVGGYQKLSDRTWITGKDRKVSEILGSDYEPILVQHPGTGEILKLATQQAVSTSAAKLKRGSKKAGKTSANAPARDEELEAAVSRAKALAIHKAAPSKLGKVEILYIFARMIDDYSFESFPELQAMLGMKEEAGHSIAGAVMKRIEALSEADLTKTFVAIMAVEEQNGFHNTRHAKELMARIKVDLKKVEKETTVAVKRKREGKAVAKVVPAKKAKKK